MGWDSSTMFDLDIKHEANNNIRLYTDNILRGGVRNNGAVLLGTTMILGGSALTVVKENGNPFSNTAVNGRLLAPQDITNVYAGFFEAKGNVTVRNAGVAGISVDDIGQFNYGIASRMCNGPNNTAAYAIYGKVCSPCIGSCWALWLDGPSFSSIGPMGSWQGSDASLKTNIQALTGGLDMIDQLSPKSYNFIEESGLQNLPSGMQYGVLAQELEMVIPHAVTDATSASFTSDESEFVEFKAVNYQQLIPVLIIAFQERQAEIDQQAVLIAQLEEAISAAESEIQLLNE